jgi:chromosome segregation ATPase
MVDNNDSEAVTTIDSLMNTIKLNGRSELVALSASLKADPRVVEKWAKILEDNGLVKVTYVTGRMFIEPVTASTDHTTMVSNKIAVTEAQIEHELNAQTLELEKFSKMLDKVSLTAMTMETLLAKAMPPEVRESTNEISKTYELMQSQKIKAEVVRKTAIDEFGALNAKVAEMMSKLEYLASPKVGESVDQNMAKLRESMAHADEFRASIDAINKNKERAFQDMKKSLDQQLSDLNARLGRTNAEIEARMKAYAGEMRTDIGEISAYTATAKEGIRELERLKKDQEAIKKMLVESRGAFGKEYGKVADEVRRAELRLKSEAARVAGDLDQIRSRLAEPAKLQESINQARAEVSKTRGEMGRIAEEMARQKAQLDALGASLDRISAATSGVESTLKSETPASMGQRIASINAAYQAIDANKSKAEQLRASVDKQFDDANKKIDGIIAKIDAFSADKRRTEAYEKLAKIEAMSKNMEQFRAALDSVAKDKDSSLAQIRSNFSAQIKDLNMQIEHARRQIDPQVRAYAETMRASLQEIAKSAATASAGMKKLEAFRKEHENTMRTIVDMKAKFDDRYNGVLGEMSKSEQVINDNSASIYKVLEDVKSRMGEPMKIHDSIKAVQAEIAETRTVLNNIKSEVAQIAQQLAALKKSTNIPMERQLYILNDILGKTATTGLEITGVKGNIDKTAANMITLTGGEQKGDGNADKKKGRGGTVKHKGI